MQRQSLLISKGTSAVEVLVAIEAVFLRVDPGSLRKTQCILPNPINSAWVEIR